MLTVKEWEQIRRAYFVEQKSIREIARETGHARRTVQRMIDSDKAPSYKRRAPKKAHNGLAGAFEQKPTVRKPSLATNAPVSPQ